MKKVLSVLFILLAMVCVVSLLSCDDEDSPDDIVKDSSGLEYIYIEKEDAYALYGIGTCTDREITVSAIVKGKPVVAIKSYALAKLEDVDQIFTITLPDSIKGIDREAFANNISLRIINIGSKDSALEAIGSAIFSNTVVTEIYFKGTMAEWKSIDFPTQKGANGWNYRNHTTDDLTVFCTDGRIIYALDGTNTIFKEIPNESPVVESEGLEFTINDDGKSYSVSGIGTCTDTDIVIPSKYNGKPVTSIGEYAFTDCTSLTSITIPDSVTSIGMCAINGCISLTSITIPDSVTSIGAGAFIACESLKSVTIPDSVTSISDSAFSCCTSLTSITIPDSVKSIGYGAFNLCESLTSVTIPNSVKSIGEDAFRSCYSLKNAIIGDSVTIIGDGAFSLCEALASITISNSVTSIGAGAFADCKSLSSVTIPDSVTSISDSAFSCCTSLASVNIPDTVSSIGDNAFSGCTSLMSISVDENNQHYKSIDGNLYSKDATTLIQYAIGKKDASFAIPDSVTEIGTGAFYNCTSLTSITIPCSVASISSAAFLGCTSLTNATFENTEGWWVAQSSSAISGENISSTDLANPANAATYLKMEYYSIQYWKCN